MLAIAMLILHRNEVSLWNTFGKTQGKKWNVGRIDLDLEI